MFIGNVVSPDAAIAKYRQNPTSFNATPTGICAPEDVKL
jgi:hypothetical protein